MKNFSTQDFKTIKKLSSDLEQNPALIILIVNLNLFLSYWSSIMNISTFIRHLQVISACTKIWNVQFRAHRKIALNNQSTFQRYNFIIGNTIYTWCNSKRLFGRNRICSKAQWALISIQCIISSISRCDMLSRVYEHCRYEDYFIFSYATLLF